jgi:hypothetical protein
MKFRVDDADLSLSVELDAEPEAPDLTAGPGDRILDIAGEEMIRAHARRESPAGAPWGPLRASTVRQEGHAAIGVRTGGWGSDNGLATRPRKLGNERGRPPSTLVALPAFLG